MIDKLLTDKTYQNIDELKEEIAKLRKVNVRRSLSENVKVSDRVSIDN